MKMSAKKETEITTAKVEKKKASEEEAEKKTRPTEYGTPVEGSKTEARGRLAHQRISREILELCSIIQQEGANQGDETFAIKFIDLFQIYTRISNKLVGVLLRARKHGLLDFEGETLFQGRDDDVTITLLQSADEVRKKMGAEKAGAEKASAEKTVKKDFQWGKCM